MFDIAFKRITPLKVIRKLSSTFNATTFLIRAILDGNEIECCLKILKQFKHNNEIALLSKGFEFAPDVIEYDDSQWYIVYGIANGIGYLYTSECMKKQIICSSAEKLSEIHKINFGAISHRQYEQHALFDSALQSKFIKIMPDIKNYIVNYGNIDTDFCFIHGDYHVQNMMFDRCGNVSNIIDWEHCGLYHKEYDLAYAVIPRLDCYFNTQEVELFLNSYSGQFDENRFLYYYYQLSCVCYENHNRCSDELYKEMVSNIKSVVKPG